MLTLDLNYKEMWAKWNRSGEWCLRPAWWNPVGGKLSVRGSSLVSQVPLEDRATWVWGLESLALVVAKEQWGWGLMFQKGPKPDELGCSMGKL